MASFWNRLGAGVDFALFKDSKVVHDVLKRAIDLDVSQCVDWVDYRQSLLAGRRDDFVDRVRALSGKFSASELAILCSALAAADYVWLANEMSGGAVWSLLESCDPSTRRAVAAAMLAI